MTKITLMHCPKSPNELVGVYKDGKLVATQDNSSSEDELLYCVERHGGKDCEIRDSEGDYTSVHTLPKELVYSKPFEKAEILHKLSICEGCEADPCTCDKTQSDKPAKQPAKKAKSVK